MQKLGLIGCPRKPHLSSPKEREIEEIALKLNKIFLATSSRTQIKLSLRRTLVLNNNMGLLLKRRKKFKVANCNQNKQQWQSQNSLFNQY